MLRHMNSTADHHDDHLRYLLDQRTTRADIPGRFSTFSEVSDTPSVYSRGVFSPRHLDRHETDSFSTHDCNSPGSPTAHLRSNRERLNDPSSSMLDLDDDLRSSYAPSGVYNDDDDDDDDQRTYEAGDDEPLPRMSLLGPKMRFHSRAPWELDGEALQEEDEEESVRHVPAPSFFSRKKDHGGSSSVSFRPSEESTQSQGLSKTSFESTGSQMAHPRGVLYALAQESLSASSLGRTAPSGRQEGLRPNFNLTNLRSNSPALSLHSSPLPPPSRSPVNSSFTVDPSTRFSHHSSIYDDSDNHTSDVRYSDSRLSLSEDDIHPYANPDLARSYPQDSPLKAPLHSDLRYQTMGRSDSFATVTESYTSSSGSRFGTRSTLTADTSTPSISSKQRVSLQGKGISPPVPMKASSLLSDINGQSADMRSDRAMSPSPSGAVNNLPGWYDRANPPAFNLISLEEARAQRSRSTTVHATTSTSSDTPFPNLENESGSILSLTDSSPSSHSHPRTRGRSISAGAKAKGAFQNIIGQSKPERRDSEPAVVVNQGGVPVGKSLKHKKSGFMRLFNGRSVDKDDRPSPPPVPPLSESYMMYAAQNTQKNVKVTTHRVPVPPAHNSLSEAPSLSTFQYSPKSPVSSKRTHPPLSINILSQGSLLPGPISSIEDPSRMLATESSNLRPWLAPNSPQSAPAGITEFPALKLRPMSTLFSTHFSEHIVTDPQPILESDLDTPTSAGTSGAVSPLTPDTRPRMSTEASVFQDNGTIQTLQVDIVSAKKTWQQHIWDLEAQIRELKNEIEVLRASNKNNYCKECDRGRSPGADTNSQHSGGSASVKESVVHRPRARTGTNSRFVNAMP